MGIILSFDTARGKTGPGSRPVPSPLTASHRTQPFYTPPDDGQARRVVQHHRFADARLYAVIGDDTPGHTGFYVFRFGPDVTPETLTRPQAPLPEQHEFLSAAELEQSYRPTDDVLDRSLSSLFHKMSIEPRPADIFQRPRIWERNVLGVERVVTGGKFSVTARSASFQLERDQIIIHHARGTKPELMSLEQAQKCLRIVDSGQQGSRPFTL